MRLARPGFAVLAGGALAVTGAATTFASAQVAATAPTTASLQKSLKALETAPSSSVTITERGSSLFYPLFQEWAGAYPHSSVSLQTAAGGSGAGISGAQTGAVNIGASDAYVAPSQIASGLMDIPEVVSAQTINYNIPGLSVNTHIKLTASVLNGIYTGAITTWNAPQITSLNKGLKIPAVKIVPIHRSDGSGDTFLFSSYLYFGDPSSFLASTGPNLTVSWPAVSGALAENGNTGVLQTCQVTPGCIAYIGISYLNSELANHVGYAAVANGKGKFILPNNTTINDEIASFKTIPASGGINLVDSKSTATGYPIVNFEYAIVQQSQPNATTAQAIKAILAWGIDQTGGSKQALLGAVHFRPLPANAEAVAIKLISSIS